MGLDFFPKVAFKFNKPIDKNYIIDNNHLVVSMSKSKGLGSLDIRTGEVIADAYLDSVNKIYSTAGLLYIDRNKNYWASYYGGKLLKINTKDKTVVNYSKYLIQANFGSLVTCYFEDRTGMMWVGTDGGIVKIPSSIHEFRNYLYNSSSAQHLDISTRGMLENKEGNLYIGSYDGLLLLDIKTGTYQKYQIEGLATKPIQPNPFQMIWLDTKNILIASQTEGILIFDTEDKKFNYLYANHPKWERQLFSICKDKSGAIWVGSHLGLKIYNLEKDTLSNYAGAGLESNIKTANIWSIVESETGDLWVGSNSGLFVLDKNRQVKKVYNLHSTPALNNEEILYILPDKNNVFWLGSRGGGLMALNYSSNTLLRYTTSEGLSNNTVYGMIMEGDFIWISTDNGLSRFDKHTKLFRNYYEKDGIGENEFNSASFIKSKKGRLYFGGINGITSFNHNDLTNDAGNVYIILTSLVNSKGELLNKPILQDTLIDIDLPYSNKFLSINFALTDYFYPSLNKFYYKIEGFDDDWKSLEGQNFLRLNDLPSGHYQLWIKGKNMNGAESKNMIKINLSVAQIYYKEIWFWVLILVLISTIIYMIFQFRLKQLVKLQNLRTSISSDLHDEVGSMLTRISILTEQAKYKHKQIPEMEQIAKASREATTTMSDVLWSVDARNDKMGNLIDRMREHADKMLLPLDIYINFKVESIDTNQIVTMQIRRSVLLIFKEAIHNIVKHANATTVLIVIENKGNDTILYIKDDGKGHNEKMTGGSGQGLKNMQMRADEIKAKLWIEKEEGYKVILYFTF